MIIHLVLFGIFTFANPDAFDKDDLSTQCCVNPALAPTAANYRITCTEDSYNVTKQFCMWFFILFILNCIVMFTTLVTLVAHCMEDKCKMVVNLMSCLSCLTALASFVMYIMGTVWRWSDAGAFCSGALVT